MARGINVNETEAPDTTTEPETEAPETEATADTNTSVDTNGDKATDTNAATEPTENGGCASVVGFGAIAILAAAAAFVVLKKKA